MSGIESREAAKPQRRTRWRPKKLDTAPDDSREWLIWSRYHHAWHRRSFSGGAAGYTTNIIEAGIFGTRKAREYHDGTRNCAIHITKQAAKIRKAVAVMQARHDEERLSACEQIAHLRAFAPSREPTPSTPEGSPR